MLAEHGVSAGNGIVAQQDALAQRAGTDQLSAIMGRTPVRPMIIAESVSISGEALLIGMIVLLVLAVVGVALLAGLVYVGAYVATTSRHDRRPLGTWQWVTCTVISVVLIVLLPDTWYIGPIAAPFLGAAFALRG